MIQGYVVGLAIVALAVVVAIPIDAHQEDIGAYSNLVVTLDNYSRTSYAGYDLVQFDVTVENLNPFPMDDTRFWLGGPEEYEDDPADNPDSEIRFEYKAATYAEIRGRNGVITQEDCNGADRWTTLEPGNTQMVQVCFMIGSSFQPDGLYIRENGPYIYDDLHPAKGPSDKCDVQRATYSHGGYMDEYDDHSSHICTYNQVIPFTDESSYCHNRFYEVCNTANVQRITSSGYQPAPSPEPNPEPPKPSLYATLLYSMYHNNTGMLVLVFDRPVVPYNSSGIELIQNFNAYIQNGSSTDMGDATPYTQDNKQQSPILAFMLSDTVRAQTTKSLGTHGDLVLVINPRAIYVAEDFTDITASNNNSAILAPDIAIIR